MTKAEIVAKISEKLGIEKTEVQNVVEHFMEEIKDSLEKGAAEIDGADFAVALTDFGFRCHFFDDFVGVNAAVTLFPRVAVEAAEHAVVGAEGDVQIGERVGICGMGELLPPDVLPLRTGNRYAAPYRHQRLSFRKGFRRRLAWCPNKLLFHN